jgi:hypothetical protein
MRQRSDQTGQTGPTTEPGIFNWQARAILLLDLEASHVNKTRCMCDLLTGQISTHVGSVSDRKYSILFHHSFFNSIKYYCLGELTGLVVRAYAVMAVSVY